MTQPSNRFAVQGKVKELKGSVLLPENAGLRFVLSVTNTAGKPESPLYPIFDKKWKKVKEDARGWFVNKTGEYKLGAINQTAVQSDTWVIHLLCQNDTLVTDAKALEESVKKAVALAKTEKASVHISNVLVKDVPELKKLASKFTEQGINVYFYDENA